MNTSIQTNESSIEVLKGGGEGPSNQYPFKYFRKYPVSLK